MSMLAQQITDEDLSEFSLSRVLYPFINVLKLQIRRLRETSDNSVSVKKLTNTNLELLFILTNILKEVEILLAVMENEKLTSLFTDVQSKLEKMTADLHRHESNTMHNTLHAANTALEHHQIDFLKLLSSIPVSKANKNKIKLLKEKMLQIAAVSKESGSIQGELILAGQMKELLTLILRINKRLSEEGKKSGLWGEDCGEDPWRRLAESPIDLSSEDSLTAQQRNQRRHENVGSIVSRQLEEQRDNEDNRTGRKRNRLKRNGRRKDDPDTPTMATTVTLPAEILAQPVDPDLARALSPVEDDGTTTPPPICPLPVRPEGRCSTLDAGFSYAVAYSPDKDYACSYHSDNSKTPYATTSRSADTAGSDASRDHVYESQTDVSENVPSYEGSDTAFITSASQSMCRDRHDTVPASTGGQQMDQPQLNFQSKLSSCDTDSGMVPDISSFRYGNLSGQQDPRLDASNISSSRFGDVSGQQDAVQNVSSISGYVPSPYTGDPSFCNVFDGLDIRLSPSETSMHSFASFYSDYQPHECSTTKRLSSIARLGPKPDHMCQQSPAAKDEDEVSTVLMDRSSESFGLNSFDVRFGNDTENTGFDGWKPRNTGVTESNEGPEVKRKCNRSLDREFDKRSLYASTDLPLRSLMLTVLFLSLMIVVCFYLKTSGVVDLFQYYTWWEVLYKNTDVTKMGNSLF